MPSSTLVFVPSTDPKYLLTFALENINVFLCSAPGSQKKSRNPRDALAHLPTPQIAYGTVSLLPLSRRAVVSNPYPTAPLLPLPRPLAPPPSLSHFR